MGWRRAPTAPTCSGSRPTRCRPSATGSAPAATGPIFKGKWHASHAHLDAEDGEGYLLSIDDDGTPIEENIAEVPEGGPARRVRLLGVGRARAARARQAQHGHGQGPLHRRRDNRSAEAPRRRRERRAVADGLLVPQPARRLALRPRRAGAGPALPPSRGAARRAGADSRRGPVDQALVPAELRRHLGNDPRAAAVDRDPPEVLLPAAGDSRRADHTRARRPARRAARTRTRS